MTLEHLLVKFDDDDEWEYVAPCGQVLRLGTNPSDRLANALAGLHLKVCDECRS